MSEYKKNDQQWYLTDAGGQSLPLHHEAAERWQFLAETLGRPFSCMVLFEEGGLWMLK